MKNLCFVFVTSLFLMLACQVELPATPDSTCNVPDAGLAYEIVDGKQSVFGFCPLAHSINIQCPFVGNQYALQLNADRKKIKVV